MSKALSAMSGLTIERANNGFKLDGFGYASGGVTWVAETPAQLMKLVAEWARGPASTRQIVPANRAATHYDSTSL